MKNMIAAVLVSFVLVACGGSKDEAGGAKGLGSAFDEVIAGVEAAKGDCAKVASSLEANAKKHAATFAAFAKSMDAKKAQLKDKYKDPKDIGKVLTEMMKMVPKEVMEKGMKLRTVVGKCASDEKVKAAQAKFKALSR